MRRVSTIFHRLQSLQFQRIRLLYSSEIKLRANKRPRSKYVHTYQAEQGLRAGDGWPAEARRPAATKKKGRNEKKMKKKRRRRSASHLKGHKGWPPSHSNLHSWAVPLATLLLLQQSQQYVMPPTVARADSAHWRPVKFTTDSHQL